jgi:V/A-type H+-transporting ATPase subunit I
MVEKMKRLYLLMAASDSDEVLSGLQELGVVHIETDSVVPDEDLEQMKRSITDFKKSRDTLEGRRPDEDSFSSGQAKPAFRDAGSIHRRVQEIVGRIADLQGEAERHTKDLSILEPWGDYSPESINSLENAGIAVSFHAASSKVFGETDFKDRHVEIINEDKSKFYFVELRKIGGETALPETLFPEERLPDTSRSVLLANLEKAKSGIDELEAELTALSGSLGILEAEIGRLETLSERRTASLALSETADGEVTRLSGYIPVSLLDDLEAFLESRSILPLIRDPNETWKTPIRLKNGPVARLFEPITKIFGLPQYVEIDTTPFFAPFFAFFFGLCLADVGYGAIVTIGAAILFFLSGKKGVKSLAALGFILGLMTVIGGLFLNTFFGMKIDGLPNISPAIRSMLLFRDIDDAMAFSIMLGVIQILLGFIMQTVNRARQDGFQAALQPLGTLMLIVGTAIWAVGRMGESFAVGPMAIGVWIAGIGDTARIGLGTASVGIILILLFNNPHKKFWIRPLMGLWEMYGIVSGVPGDILSYIRLFALSLAGGLLGGAINLIATMIRGDNPGIFAWFFMLLVLVVGHFINFALAALGAFVHPLRLTFVEFYKSVGFAGGGRPYAPYGGKTS